MGYSNQKQLDAFSNESREQTDIHDLHIMSFLVIL
jgi:hypothetical protein